MNLIMRKRSIYCNAWQCSCTIYNPGRFDLPYHALMSDKTGSPCSGLLLQKAFTPSDWYSRPEGYMQQLQAAFICGRYEQMWLSTARALDGRYFPLTDHHIRALTILGCCERAMFLFQQLYNAQPF